MASRREHRMNAVQNDALVEFENFKKKYLLVNKHVTKLNSTLSIRIEELNAQMSKLQVENLRLRGANINLVAQLRREREGKGRDTRTVALVDAATAEVFRQLSIIRDAMMPPSQSSPASHSIPTPPTSSPAAAPPIRITGPVHPTPSTRLCVARAPDFPSLVETSEPLHYRRRRSSGGGTAEDSDSEMEHHARVAALRPTPGAYRVPAPVAQLDPEVEAESKARRPVRRQSGLLARGAAASTIGYEEDNGREDSPVEIVEPVLIKPKTSKASSVSSCSSASTSTTDSKRPKRKLVESEPDDAIKSIGVIVDARDENDVGEEEGENEVVKQVQPLRSRSLASTAMLQDVTNSPRRTASLKLKKEKDQYEDEEPVSMGYMGTPAVNKTKPRNRTLIPTPTSGSGRLTPIPGADEDAAPGGRERRARKSVNYAEPKLNTKMRKPTPDATSFGPRISLPATKPRSSSASSIHRDSSPAPDSPMPALLEPHPLPKSESAKPDSGSGDAAVTVRTARKRRVVPASWAAEDEDEGEAPGEEADDEYMPHGGGVRRKSATKAADRRHSSAV